MPWIITFTSKDKSILTKRRKCAEDISIILSQTEFHPNGEAVKIVQVNLSLYIYLWLTSSSTEKINHIQSNCSSNAARTKQHSIPLSINKIHFKKREGGSYREPTNSRYCWSWSEYHFSCDRRMAKSDPKFVSPRQWNVALWLHWHSKTNSSIRKSNNWLPVCLLRLQPELQHLPAAWTAFCLQWSMAGPGPPPGQCCGTPQWSACWMACPQTLSTCKSKAHTKHSYDKLSALTLSCGFSSHAKNMGVGGRWGGGREVWQIITHLHFLCLLFECRSAHTPIPHFHAKN